MDLDLIAVHFNDIAWILMAFVFGLAAKFISLPPMLGYLVAGFALNAAGVQSDATLDAVADMGVTLLLFGIGLKLQVKSLFRPEIWAVSIIHLLVTVAVFGAAVFLLGCSGLREFTELSPLESLAIAFALSFSSTVFAVKVFEEKAEMSTLHGRIAIGILIMQDLFAVIFLTATSGKTPTQGALLLLLLIPLRPLLLKLIQRAGHGELLILCGMLLAFGGAALFEAVGVKADLGALLFGALLSGDKKSGKLSNALLAFKEIFLVAFFLSIGFNGAPGPGALAVAAALALAMPLKSLLFYRLLTAFKLRARTSFLTTLALSNYSEFGLIVGAIGVANKWLSPQWLVIMAIALTISFVLASLANTRAHALYAAHEERLRRLQRQERLPDDRPIDVGRARILIFGMGRVGIGAYDSLREQYGDALLGIDSDAEAVDRNAAAGRHVICGDATDYDFWERLRPGSLLLIMLTMPNINELLAAVELIRQTGHESDIAVAVKHDRDIERLREAGVDSAYNIYAEAGIGFAGHALTNGAGKAHRPPPKLSSPAG